MGMGFAPTWLRQVSPPASQNHFNHRSRVGSWNFSGFESSPAGSHTHTRARALLGRA